MDTGYCDAKASEIECLACYPVGVYQLMIRYCAVICYIKLCNCEYLIVFHLLERLVTATHAI